MKIGVVAPVFHDDARRCVEFARRAEDLGFDAACVFDHLFPLEQPERPAVAWLPTLAAMGEATESVKLFPIIARVGIRPNELLVQECKTMSSLFGDRFIAAIGIGDARARVEYEAYGVPYKSFDERLNDAETVCKKLKEKGFETWISAKSEVIQNRLASFIGGVNVWESTADELLVVQSRFPNKVVSWAGVWNPDKLPSAELLDVKCDWLIYSFAREAELQLEQLAKWRLELAG